MAKTFLSFDTSLGNGDLLSETRIEEEYDAKNDETFGALDDTSDEDWEQQHEQFAEIEENTKLTEEIENSLSQLVFDDSDSPPINGDDSIWSVKPQNGDLFSNSLLSALQQKAANSYNVTGKSFDRNDLPKPLSFLGTSAMPPKKICTVEELEKSLLNDKSRTDSPAMGPTIGQKLPFPPPQFMSTRLPPGLPPPPLPHQLQHGPPMGHHPGPIGPGLIRLGPPHFQRPPPPHPPGFMFPGPSNGQFPVNHPFFNYPPPPRNMGMQSNMQMNRNYNMPPQYQQQQRIRHDSYNRQRNNTPTMNCEQNRDEYAGLMTNREKQWLLNIQLLQLNTGTPYFDDYYYTIYKSRKANNNNNRRHPHDKNDRNHRNQHNRNNDRQENVLTPRVYTPLQFENSLGKLQCGSVTAPRKIIDMDIVAPEKESDGTPLPRDTRKSKQILLELESFYSLFLKALDIKNPMAISDMEKHREMKQKQRLRELEAAPTPEQKKEVFKLLQQESIPVVEDQKEYLSKVVNGLLQEEKFTGYFYYSKGKMLVLRLLPYLTQDSFGTQLKDLWFKIIHSIPTVAKRDALGDNILPKFYPPFKSHVQTYKMSGVISLVMSLKEILKQETSRSTPINYQAKSRWKPHLYFILSNKFGVSVLTALIMRTEILMSADGEVNDSQKNEWFNFLMYIVEVRRTIKDISSPIESVPEPIFNKHLGRYDALAPESKTLLLRLFVERDPNAPVL